MLVYYNSIKTQYCGDLNFDFRFNNYQAKARYPDIAKWRPEMQGTDTNSYTSYGARIYKHVMNVQNSYRCTGDAITREYACHLKAVGSRPLKYFVASLLYFL